MDDRTRLHLIEMELDNTTPNGPNRSKRQKLKREKATIIRRKEGMDPLWFVGEKGRMGPLSEDKRDQYRTKKCVCSIINSLSER